MLSGLNETSRFTWEFRKQICQSHSYRCGKLLIADRISLHVPVSSFTCFDSIYFIDSLHCSIILTRFRDEIFTSCRDENRRRTVEPSFRRSILKIVRAAEREGSQACRKLHDAQQVDHTGLLVWLRIDVQSKIVKATESLFNRYPQCADVLGKQWSKIFRHRQLKFKFCQVGQRHVA